MNKIDMDSKRSGLTENSYASASCISKLFFWWVFPILVKGKSSQLEPEDLYKTLDEDGSERLGALLASKWELEQSNANDKGVRPKLVNTFMALYGRKLALLCVCYCLDGWILAVAQPIFLRLLIQSFAQDGISTWKPYIYTAGLCISTFLHVLIVHPCDFAISRIGMKCRVGVSALIYRKVLLLKSKGDTSIGHVTNILLNDTAGFDTNLNFIPYILVGPIQFVIFMYLLWIEIGVSCLSGAGLIVLLIPLNYFLGTAMSNFRLEIAEITDKRCGIMSDLIMGIRIIKMYVWEQPLIKMVQSIRSQEITQIRKRGYFSGMHLATVNFAPKLVPFFTILTYYLMGNLVTPEKVFFTLVVMSTVILASVYCIPQAVTGVGQLIVSINRIEKFLLLKEQKLLEGPTSASLRVSGIPSVTLENVNARWTNETHALSDVSVNLHGNQLVMIVGTVGSGKTSFLQALIGELPLSSGQVLVNGAISYASQEPWIFDGSIRQNITFGLGFDERRYRDTISVCALEPDLKEFPYGDGTAVGEKGSILSGGQKVRLNLARSVYRKADIYLLDDPLSAVDTGVSHHIFEKCIKTYLQDSLRILITHQLQYLHLADYIIVFEHGAVIASGSYEKLVHDGYDFNVIMTSRQGNESSGQQNAVSQESVRMGVTKFNEEIGNKENCKESVTPTVYWKYFKATKSTFFLLSLLFGFFLAQILLNGVDYWLSFWTNKSIPPNFMGFWEENVYVIVYSTLVAFVVVFCTMRTLLFFEMTTRISQNLHNAMLHAVVEAPTIFFDDNPSGRIINRFSKDVSTLDELLPTAFADTLAIFFNMFGTAVIVIMANYYLSIPTVVATITFYFIRQYFVPTSRSLKNMESISRSPIVTHLGATLQGLDTIRSLKSGHVVIEKFDRYQDLHSAAWFLFIATNRWFGIWLEVASVVFLIFVTVGFLIVQSDSSYVGIAIASTLTLMGSFQWGMRQSVATENFMTSIQRILEYVKIKPEIGSNIGKANNPPRNWPHAGQISFQAASLCYTKDGRQVLKNLTFEILSKQKIGIVGRTGAGKSSIVAALLRMTQLSSGHIFIDGININDISLHDLRRAISVIPQDPYFFATSLRFNLDPGDEFSDEQIWKVINELDLSEIVENLKMNVSNGGFCNFSVGQRQLICLARAILRKSKIVVLDEATANIDQRTDDFIQAILRFKFLDCTVITIAHRLNTVMECDKLLVLDNGMIKEYDHPHLLLMNPDGVFTSMMTQNDNSNLDIFRKMATESYLNNQNKVWDDGHALCQTEQTANDDQISRL